MSVKLYMDENVPAAITEGLCARGVDVLTAQEDGMAQRLDPELLERAAILGRVIFSQDKHFLREAAQRQRSGVRFSGVVYSHQLALTIGQCVSELELLAKACDAAEFENRVEYLPLR